MSVAAELTGVHPQTLRTYERKGLVHPARSRGGARRYSRQDVARVQRITELTAAGVNLAGVERILDLEERLRAPGPADRTATPGDDRRSGMTPVVGDDRQGGMTPVVDDRQRGMTPLVRRRAERFSFISRNRRSNGATGVRSDVDRL